ncbi:Murein DD-endopeptidase MepM and murein hydrolase activator NlpD, contain LysM domain [Halopseudomonas formosensis]|uniref:Murein DD-endopeptidase MepM and murein hydrolase activator NlpD, contain LysM domain n=2 Tax=Halopseudomonas formosensis TaxID=1002526 RepID=A0A1I6C4W5_9GAMM|nr:peptidoglycan DD-metalloendopeptidase family protein [Halopseudomonas formosensis]SFQ88174.1 Murein DD-endopeptidase MepM and murein hydrolase activator NlpD, contain LysM domain [Halopseudomonas formosensis]
MGHHKSESPRYPKSHIMAASGIAAALSIFLLVIPTTEVEAKRTLVQLDLHEVTAEHKEPVLSEELDALISETVTFSSPIELTSIQETLSTAASPEVVNAGLSLQPAPLAAQPVRPEWTTMTVDAGDTLSILFQNAGLSANTLHAVINSSQEAKAFTRLRVGQQVEFKLDNEGQLLAMRSPVNSLETIRIDRDGDSYSFSKDVIEPEVAEKFASGTIDSSLFVAAQNAGLSHNLTMQMANIFGYDVDFAKEIRQGDRFEVLYEEKQVDGERVGTGNILAARFTNRGNTYTAVRYTDANGHTSYYRADGTSMRKAFIRTPVEFARISSRFNPGRRHPVLNKIRAHKGVDYAAPTGTPIKATGDGRVVHVGRKGGYGNTVVIKHGQTYQTLYAHMSRYASGIRVGSNVSQGQIIGYVGATGLATGPHLHYEFQINGVHVDPLSVRLPASDPIPQRERSAFLALSNQLMASLDRHGATQLAQLDN